MYTTQENNGARIRITFKNVFILTINYCINITKNAILYFHRFISLIYLTDFVE